MASSKEDSMELYDLQDPSITISESKTPLSLAAKNGHVQVIDHLRSLDPEFEDEAYLKKALLLACQRGHASVVKVLLPLLQQKLESREGSDKKEEEEDPPYTQLLKEALVLACRRSADKAVVDLLLSPEFNTRGRRLKVDDGIKGDYPALYWAVIGNKYELAEHLLARHHANPNKVLHDADGDTQTLLQCAIGQMADTSLVKLLIDHGVSVNQCIDGRPPLYFALQPWSMDVDTLGLLLAAGANPSAPMGSRKTAPTPLQYLFDQNCCKTIFRQLLYRYRVDWKPLAQEQLHPLAEGIEGKTRKRSTDVVEKFRTQYEMVLMVLGRKGIPFRTVGERYFLAMYPLWLTGEHKTIGFTEKRKKLEKRRGKSSGESPGRRGKGSPPSPVGLKVPPPSVVEEGTLLSNLVEKVLLKKLGAI